MRLCGRAYELPQRRHVCNPPCTVPCDDNDDLGKFTVGVKDVGDDISVAGDNNGVAVVLEPSNVGDVINNFDDGIFWIAIADVNVVFAVDIVSSSLNRTAGVKRRKSQGWSSVGVDCRMFNLTSPVGGIKLLNFKEENTIFG